MSAPVLFLRSLRSLAKNLCDPWLFVCRCHIPIEITLSLLADPPSRRKALQAVGVCGVNQTRLARHHGAVRERVEVQQKTINIDQAQGESRGFVAHQSTKKRQLELCNTSGNFVVELHQCKGHVQFLRREQPRSGAFPLSAARAA